MIPTKPVDIILDCLLRIAGTAFVFSLLSHLLCLPHVAFVAGAVFAALGLGLLIIGKGMPQLRPLIAYRVLRLIAGITLGVLA